MQSKLNPYINFKGTARSAMKFYESVFGGKLDLTSYAEGGMTEHQTEADQIMHGMLVAENGMTIMGADTPDGMPFVPGTNMSISLSGDNEAELSDYFAKLADGGNIAQPLTKAPWGDTFGMVTDKFVVFWMVNIASKQA